MRSDRTTERPLIVTGVNAVLELLRSGAPVDRLMVGPGPRRAEILAAAGRRGLPGEDADRRALDRLAGQPGHQGAVAVAPPFRYHPLDGIEAAGPLALVLDGIQDPRNLGAILRTARAVGVAGVVMPQDRSVGITGVVAGVSAGAVFGMRITRVPNLVRAMQDLRRLDYWLAGLVPTGAPDLFVLDLPARVALVVGGEGDGLRPLVRRTCDFEARIPMAAGVESLNVSVATGVALFELRRRTGQMR